MKKECEETRKALPKYLHGHVFRTERGRIERHLAQCVVCRSEFEALRRTEETLQILRDINASEGVVGRVRDGVSALGKVKTLIYRPLWIVAIVLAVTVLSYYLMKPRQLTLEIERIVKTEPTASTSAAMPLDVPASGPAGASAPTMPAGQTLQAASAAPVLEPLVVTITLDNDKSAVRRVNEAMRGRGQLRKMKFTGQAKEVSGSLTVKELLAFFSQIESFANVSYSRKRLDSFPAMQPVPVKLKLKTMPQPPATSPSAPPPAQELPKAPAESAAPAPPPPEPSPSQ
jgi:putative zinc finger protein